MDMRKTNKKLTKDQSQRVRKVTETTPYDTCSEALSSFGGLLPLVKFLDLIRFKDHFDTHFKGPERTPVIGNYRMILGLVTLLFVGFQRLGHFEYIRFDPMICGILKISSLPVVSTFWRYLQSLNMHHCKQLLFLQSALRKESWALRGFRPLHITVDIDTTVSTVYGDIQGAHKGHNNNHRGKEALRPVLCVIAQTGEFLCGAQRKGKTISSKEVSKHVSQFKQLLPDFIKTVLVRADGEFMGSTCI